MMEDAGYRSLSLHKISILAYFILRIHQYCLANYYHEGILTPTVEAHMYTDSIHNSEFVYLSTTTRANGRYLSIPFSAYKDRQQIILDCTPI